MSGPPTYGDLIRLARERLRGPEHPSFEAEELLSRATGRPRASFHARRGEAATPDEARRFGELVGRREAGEPLQYLLGEWEFLGRTFRVDPRALIPRRETELIVAAAHDVAPEARWILDAGTGTGILAVSLALERPAARVVAVDRSVAALALAAENASLHGVSSRVLLAASDWTAALARASRRPFELVVANPPYVPLADAPHVERTVSDHEPPMALWGGADGLDPLRALLASLPPLLASGAPFVFEIGYGQAREASGLVERSGSFALEEIRLDAGGIPRTAVARRR